MSRTSSDSSRSFGGIAVAGSSTGQRRLQSDRDEVEHDQRAEHPAVPLRVELRPQHEAEHRCDRDCEEQRTSRKATGSRCGHAPTAEDKRGDLGRGNQERGHRTDSLSMRVRGSTRPDRRGRQRGAGHCQGEDNDCEHGQAAPIHEHCSGKRQETVRGKQTRRCEDTTLGLSEVTEQQDPDRDDAGYGQQPATASNTICLPGTTMLEDSYMRPSHRQRPSARCDEPPCFH